LTARRDARAVDRSEPFELGAERRFPLDLRPARPTMWEMYEEALRHTWDPDDARHWQDAAAELGRADGDERAAAALVWSHRAWIEFTGVAESEALLVRLCLEPGIGVDTKYCLALRAVEKARAADACHLLADRLAAYVPDPAPGVEAVLNADLVRRALHRSVDADGYVIAHLYVQALVDLEVWERTLAAVTTTTPAPIGRLLGLIVGDKRRQVDWAWEHVTARAGSFDAAVASEQVRAVVETEELAGRRVAAFLPESAARSSLLGAQERATTAALGAIHPDDERAALAAALDRAAVQLASVGVTLTPPR
jgi:hypothetical protein